MHLDIHSHFLSPDFVKHLVGRSAMPRTVLEGGEYFIDCAPALRMGAGPRIMEMDIKNTKIELIQWLTTLEDKSLIEKILALRNTEQEDWWKDTSEAEKNSILKGLEDAESGKLKSHSEARKTYEKWL